MSSRDDENTSHRHRLAESKHAGPCGGRALVEKRDSVPLWIMSGSMMGAPLQRHGSTVHLALPPLDKRYGVGTVGSWAASPVALRLGRPRPDSVAVMGLDRKAFSTYAEDVKRITRKEDDCRELDGNDIHETEEKTENRAVVFEREKIRHSSDRPEISEICNHPTQPSAASVVEGSNRSGPPRVCDGAKIRAGSIRVLPQTVLCPPACMVFSHGVDDGAARPGCKSETALGMRHEVLRPPPEGVAYNCTGYFDDQNSQSILNTCSTCSSRYFKNGQAIFGEKPGVALLAAATELSFRSNKARKAGSFSILGGGRWW